jgi:hypothetical protein
MLQLPLSSVLMLDEKHPTPEERDDPVKIDLDPETALKGLLKVDPEAEPVAKNPASTPHKDS